VAGHATGIVVITAVDGGKTAAVLFIGNDDLAASGADEVRRGNGDFRGEAIGDALKEESDASAGGLGLGGRWGGRTEFGTGTGGAGV
jgi:hypothetical protein